METIGKLWNDEFWVMCSVQELRIMGSRFGELMLFVCSLTWLKQSWAKELKSAVSGFRGFGSSLVCGSHIPKSSMLTPSRLIEHPFQNPYRGAYPKPLPQTPEPYLVAPWRNGAPSDPLGLRDALYKDHFEDSTRAPRLPWGPKP